MPDARDGIGGHHDDGIAVGRIVRIGLGIVVAVALVVALVMSLTRHIEPKPAGGIMPAPDSWISGPSLESDPQARLARYLADKQARLRGYAWVDRQAGIARIPLDQAMQALAAQDAARRGTP
jgi:hypothetical protein